MPTNALDPLGLDTSDPLEIQRADPLGLEQPRAAFGKGFGQSLYNFIGRAGQGVAGILEGLNAGPADFAATGSPDLDEPLAQKRSTPSGRMALIKASPVYEAGQDFVDFAPKPAPAEQASNWTKLGGMLGGAAPMALGPLAIPAFSAESVGRSITDDYQRAKTEQPNLSDDDAAQLAFDKGLAKGTITAATFWMMPRMLRTPLERYLVGKMGQSGFMQWLGGRLAAGTEGGAVLGTQAVGERVVDNDQLLDANTAKQVSAGAAISLLLPWRRSGRPAEPAAQPAPEMPPGMAPAPNSGSSIDDAVAEIQRGGQALRARMAPGVPEVPDITGPVNPPAAAAQTAHVTGPEAAAAASPADLADLQRAMAAGNAVARPEVRPAEAELTQGRKEAEAQSVAEAPVKRGGRLYLRPRPDGVPDVLDDIQELGGIRPPGDDAGGEYDGYSEAMNSGPAALLRSRKAVHGPTTIIGELQSLRPDANLRIQSPDDLWDAIKQASDARQTLRERGGGEEARLQKFWEAATNPKNPNGLIRINADDLQPGDVFRLRGPEISNEELEVTHIDPETYEVTVKDGPKLATQTLPAGTEIWVQRNGAPSKAANAALARGTESAAEKLTQGREGAEAGTESVQSKKARALAALAAAGQPKPKPAALAPGEFEEDLQRQRMAEQGQPDALHEEVTAYGAKPPEMMTRGEYAAAVVRGSPDVKEGLHYSETLQAMRAGRPLLAATADYFGIKPREGYERVGDRYVYNPDTFRLAPAESVAEQKARLAREEAQRTANAQREETERRRAARLQGGTGDLGQADMLGGGDLFSLREEPGDPRVWHWPDDRVLSVMSDLETRARDPGLGARERVRLNELLDNLEREAKERGLIDKTRAEVEAGGRAEAEAKGLAQSAVERETERNELSRREQRGAASRREPGDQGRAAVQQPGAEGREPRPVPSAGAEAPAETGRAGELSAPNREALSQEIYRKPYGNLTELAQANVRDQLKRGRVPGEESSSKKPIDRQFARLVDERDRAQESLQFTGEHEGKRTARGTELLAQVRYLDGQIDILREIARAPAELKAAWFEKFLEGDPPDAVERTLDRWINKMQLTQGNLLEGITGAPVWLTKPLASGALRAVRVAYKAGKSLAEAVEAGLAYLRERKLPGYNEEQARKWLASAGAEAAKPQPGSSRRGSASEYLPSADEAPAKAQAGKSGSAAEYLIASGGRDLPAPARVVWEAGAAAYQRLKAIWQARPAKDQIARAKDEADNGAVVFGRQMANTILHNLNRAFGAKSLKELGERDALRENAFTFVIETGEGAKDQAAGANTRARLAEFRAEILGSEEKGTLWARRALAAIDFADANWDKLAPVARDYARITEAQRATEEASGCHTLYRQGGYVFHLQDVHERALFPESSGTGGTAGAPTPFRHIRDHDTYAQSIAAGVNPISLSAIDLLQRRTTLGRRLINYGVWSSGLRGMTDPATQQPIATDADVRLRADGTQDVTAPDGYSIQHFGGKELAIHNGYKGLFLDLTKDSWMRESVFRESLMKLAGTTKHATLLFDTYHLGRLALWNAVSRMEGPGYRKGVTLLDNTRGELQTMIDQGAIPREWGAQMLRDKVDIEGGLGAGLNVGSIGDNLYTDWIRKVPGIGTFNKWLFEQYQRGAMVEVFLSELHRLQALHPDAGSDPLYRQAARAVNTRFGNLGSQGWIRSKTGQDLARVIFLAPQWNESLIRSELGAVREAGAGAYDAVKNPAWAAEQLAHGRFPGGMLAKGIGTAVLGTFAANQVINYFSRGQPTWENPEEHGGAKISGYIPDVSGGPGFFLHPAAVPAETLHLLWKATERNGGDFSLALRQYVSGRLNTLSRPIWTGVTREDSLGHKLRTGTEVAGQMVKSAIPAPISGSAAYHLGKQMVTGENEEAFPGQYQKQAMQSLGVKTEPAPSPRQRVQALARDFNRAKGITPSAEFFTGPFDELNAAIERGNQRDTASALTDLLAKQTPAQIQAHYSKWAYSQPRDGASGMYEVGHPFTGQKGREAEFYLGLNAEERGQYDQAKLARQAVAQQALGALQRRLALAPAPQ